MLKSDASNVADFTAFDHLGTAATSEAYGEATLATAGRMVRLLANLTRYVPAMHGWEGQWNLDADSSFLDIGSGYGKACNPM